MAILDGVRVIECGLWMQVPFAGVALADLGAEVIKVESPAGDPLRAQKQMWGIELDIRTERGAGHIGFEAVNRGKKGIKLDLKTAQGRDVLYRIVRKSDVFLSNWSPEVAGRLQIDYESVSRENPQIVYLESTSFGSEGPKRDDPLLDPIGLAYTGFMYLPSADAAEPHYTIGGLGDGMAATVGALAVLGGLYKRSITGRGLRLEISQIGSLLWFESYPVLAATLTGRQMARRHRGSEPNPFYNVYLCGDGRWLMLGEVQPERRLADFFEILGITDLLADERFNNFAAIVGNSDKLIARLDEIFASQSREHWLSAFHERRIIASAVNNVVEASAEEQLSANGYVQQYQHPGLGDVRAVALPIKEDGEPLPIAGVAPGFGEHTEDVLRNVCEMDETEIASLHEAGVI